MQLKYVGLSCLLIVYISNQWSRYSIVYLGGVSTPECPGKNSGEVCYFEKGHEEAPLCPDFTCVGEVCKECQACYNNHTTDTRNLKYGTCINSSEFGILLSYGYMTIFCIVGLFAGRAADLYNRKNIISLAAIGWCGFTFLQGISTNFNMLLISRMGMGFFHAFSGPASLSLIADLFPPEERAKANGIYTFGIYIGGGLSSLSILGANVFGWKITSYFIALLSGIGGIGAYLILPEPRFKTPIEQGEIVPLIDDTHHDNMNESNNEDEENNEGQREPESKKMGLVDCLRIIVNDKIVMLLFLAAPLRFIGGFAIGNFLPQYYNRRFPGKNNIYGTLNALIVSIGGASSAYMGGYITDKWKKSNKNANAYVPALASLFGFIPFLGVTLAPNFYVSIFCLLLEYLIAESWFGPAITIMQERVPPSARGITISIYLFISGLIGSLAPALLGSLDTGAGYSSIQFYLTLIVGISYISTFSVFSLMSFIQ